MYIGIFVSYVLSFVFLVFALVGFGLRSDTDRFPFPSRNFAPRCKEIGTDAEYRAGRCVFSA
jgi:hypothetical protein